MDIQVAVDLLRALTERIESEEWGLHGRPSAAVAHRAKAIAEKEALRRLQQADSFDTALIVGAEAYGREIHRFQPLSFIHGPDELEINAMGAERLEG